MKIPNYIYLSLSVLWLYSGVVPIAFNQADSLAMLHRMHIPSGLDWVLFIGASVMDVAFGILILTRYRYHAYLWLVQFLTVTVYSLLVVLLLPNTALTEMLIHPFAPLFKNLPIMAILWWLYQCHKAKHR